MQWENAHATQQITFVLQLDVSFANRVIEYNYIKHHTMRHRQMVRVLTIETMVQLKKSFLTFCAKSLIRVTFSIISSAMNKAR